MHVEECMTFECKMLFEYACGFAVAPNMAMVCVARYFLAKYCMAKELHG